MCHIIASYIIKALELIFGKDVENYIKKYANADWFFVIEIGLFIAFIYMMGYLIRIAIRQLKGVNNYLINENKIKNSCVNASAKTPYSTPDFRGEIATGSCPMCGYPYVFAKRSYITGDLYFRCGSVNSNDAKKCKFKGCRKY